ncbi:YraN family protein [Allomuricauda sp. F6463D]|uniref:YraN family protein n=1 Tax=Allomuricauda sp. F6463D TaxID=2926409 RepID=UPI001FF55455|nr:YraN family protein [Muricauda sp. F6463D]MCK0160923.1 YraN family protein [Muricauda sp. F6463D]
MGNHNNFGKLGEQKATTFLLDRGYKILERNYRYLHAEIDIIAQKNNYVVIVEVKARNTGFLEDISNVITPKKVKLLTMAANHYVEQMDSDVEVRFDVITVVKKGDDFEIEHFENAFYHF